MRALPLVAAILLLASLPAASAAGSQLTLEGPRATPNVDGPAAVPVTVRLVLDGVVCRQATAVPVDLELLAARGMSARLDDERVLFPVPAASLDARTSEAIVHVLVEPAMAGRGVIEMVARYALPEECAAIRGADAGETRLLLPIDIDEPPAPVERAPPRNVDRGASLAGDPSALRSITLSERVPGPIVSASVAAIAAAVLIAVQRVRAARRDE